MGSDRESGNGTGAHLRPTPTRPATPTFTVPDVPHSFGPEQQEYENAKLKITVTLAVAQQQTRDDVAALRDVMFTGMDSLAKRVSAGLIDVRADVAEVRAEVRADIAELRTEVATMRSGVGDLSEQLGRFMGDTAVEASEGREKFDSLHEEDGKIEKRLGQAHVRAVRAEDQAKIAGVQAEMARKEAEVATLQAAMAKADARLATAHAAHATRLARVKVSAAFIGAAALIALRVFDALHAPPSAAPLPAPAAAPLASPSASQAPAGTR